MPRGRKSNKDQYIHFDQSAYYNALRKAIKEATVQARQELYELTYGGASNLSYKTEQVSLANGTKTSDEARKGALLKSITTDAVEHFEQALTGSLFNTPLGMKAEIAGYTAGVTAMSEKKAPFEKSHIGLYYEYGTGEQEDLVGWNSIKKSMGTPNPFREFGSGQPIVTRGFEGTSGGYWNDAGGNVRTSKGKGGKRPSAFVQYIGDDTPAYHWFENAATQMIPRVKEIYLAAMKSVDPFDPEFFTVKKKIVLKAKK